MQIALAEKNIRHEITYIDLLNKPPEFVDLFRRIVGNAALPASEATVPVLQGNSTYALYPHVAEYILVAFNHTHASLTTAPTSLNECPSDDHHVPKSHPYTAVGGIHLAESDVIVEYLDNAYPDSGTKLLPADPFKLALVRKNMSSNELANWMIALVAKSALRHPQDASTMMDPNHWPVNSSPWCTRGSSNSTSRSFRLAQSRRVPLLFEVCCVDVQSYFLPTMYYVG